MQVLFSHSHLCRERQESYMRIIRITHRSAEVSLVKHCCGWFSSYMRSALDRARVRKVLRDTKHPLTVREVARRVGPKVHLATVYRAIHALVRDGDARRVDLGGRAPRYEGSAHHHHHVVCTRCGLIEDVGEFLPKGVEYKVLKEAKKFKVITSHSLEFFAVCKKCI